MPKITLYMLDTYCPLAKMEVQTNKHEEKTSWTSSTTKRGVTGVGMAYKPSEKNLLACYDVEKAQEMKAQGMDDETAAKKSFRMIDLNSIMNMTVSGQAYQVYTTEKL